MLTHQSSRLKKKNVFYCIGLIFFIFFFFLLRFYRNSQRYTFALTGKTWALLRQYCPELIPKIITRASVFSRMSPDQKQQLIQELQSIGYYVGE